MLFTNTVACFSLFMGGGEGESGTPIWLLGMTGVPATTQSVADENSGSGGSGSSGSTGNARVTGMYFYHPDHLGSVAMITDGNGNVLAGGERGGKSHITYKPYGEILRTDSYGPDITKFKYNGQEEDKETGLYYYKARYYDPALGRFIQNDSIAIPNQTQGMNRSMYVAGNPIKWRDFSGQSTSKSLLGAVMGYLIAPEDRKLEGAIVGGLIGRGFDKRKNNNDLDKSLGLEKNGIKFESLVNSDLGKFLTKQSSDLVHGDIGKFVTRAYHEVRYITKRKRRWPEDNRDIDKKNRQKGAALLALVLSYYSCFTKQKDGSYTQHCVGNPIPEPTPGTCVEGHCVDDNGNICEEGEFIGGTCG